MKTKIFAFFLLSINFCLQAQNTIIPTPVSLIQEKGSFLLHTKTIVYIENSNPELLQIVGLHFNTLLENEFSITQKKPADNSKYISIGLNKTTDNSIGNEGYTLEVNEKMILLEANSVAGIFYGLQTFDQLLPFENNSKNPNISIPACKIKDYPRFAWRGLMLDVSRHFFKPDEVKDYIDWMSKYKFNTLHLHLTDDHGWRIEIKALPKLTEIGAWRVERFGPFSERENTKQGEIATYGGFYTQEEIKDLIKFATSKQITIIPEIDVPGHSMAFLAAYPEFSTLKEPKTVNPGSKFVDWHKDGTFTMKIENMLNPSDEKVFAALDVIFGEIAALFPNQYIHVGGDECYHGYWENDANCKALMKKENLKDGKELQSYFMKRVEKIISSKGKKMIGWDEILDGGLADGAAVMSWRGTKGGIKAANLGHQVIMSPNSTNYLDFTQGDRSVEVTIYDDLVLKKAYSFEPVPEGVDSKLILGGQSNLWTEKVPTIQHAFYMTYPRAFATIESLWSLAENKNWDNFTSKVESHFKRFDTFEKPICKAMFDPIVKTKKVGEKMICTITHDLSTVEMYYTIDGTFPAQYSKKYTTAFEIPNEDITLRVIAYRDGKPIGRMLTISKELLKKRVGK